MNNYLVLLVGLVCAGIGGELFVRGTVGIAQGMRVSHAIVGATVAAFATSSPELSVSINAAMAGKPQIGLGDALGSNVVNVALILALALVISGIRCPRVSVARDFPLALLMPIITGVMVLDGELSRFDGLLMLGMFLTWIGAMVVEARRQRRAVAKEAKMPLWFLTLLSCAVGLACLVAAGSLIVTGARGIAVSVGLDEFTIGATIVAVGTSVPELATTVIAKLRGHDEIGLGTVLGSNIFNGIFIVALTAMIHPITVAWHEVALVLLFGLLALMLAYPTREGVIGQSRGALLLLLYGIYLVAILQRPTA